jgi:hypothetical protein
MGFVTNCLINHTFLPVSAVLVYAHAHANLSPSSFMAFRSVFGP